MARITLLFVGKAKSPACRSLEETYLERLAHYAPVQPVEVRDSSAADPNEKIRQEGEAILKRISAGDRVVVLDERGEAIRSLELAQWVQKQKNGGVKNLVFVVGGAYGLSGAVKGRADRTLSLSALTLPHELARAVLLEQLYRAHTILAKERYHHE